MNLFGRYFVAFTGAAVLDYMDSVHGLTACVPAAVSRQVAVSRYSFLYLALTVAAAGGG